MRDETIEGFVEKLAARTPAPAGGAVAALHAAEAAALVVMVARYSTGPKYAAAAETVERVIGEADVLRMECTDLIAADAVAFGSVAAAYALPKQTAEQKATRSAAIAEALVIAAEPPAAVIAAAARLLDQTEALLPFGNRTVLGDLAAAADAIHVLLAGPGRRPSYLAADLSGLNSGHPEITRDATGGNGAAFSCGGWTAAPAACGAAAGGSAAGGHGWLTVSGSGLWMDGLRALCAAAWSAGPPPGDADEQRRIAEAVLTAIEPAR